MADPGRLVSLVLYHASNDEVCHAERSEASRATTETLRFAQGDTPQSPRDGALVSQLSRR